MPITNTPNLGLNKQDQGDEDWHIPLNENFDLLDFDFVAPLTFDPDTMEVTVDTSALLEDVRYTYVTFEDEETEKAFTFSTFGGTDDWFLAGVGQEPSSGAPTGVSAWIKPGTRTATGATLVISVSPGDGESIRVGLTIKRANV